MPTFLNPTRDLRGSSSLADLDFFAADFAVLFFRAAGRRFTFAGIAKLQPCNKTRKLKSPKLLGPGYSSSAPRQRQATTTSTGFSGFGIYFSGFVGKGPRYNIYKAPTEQTPSCSKIDLQPDLNHPENL